jgi:hypothetical protein
MPRTLKEQILGKCKHFNGVQHSHCAAGIEYHRVRVEGTPGDMRSFLPCFGTHGECSKREMPTEAEADAEVAEVKESHQRIMIARKAIVDRCGGPWKKGYEQQSGRFPCPCCGIGTLAYSRSGYNGHVHARCSTEGCVAWVE